MSAAASDAVSRGGAGGNAGAGAAAAAQSLGHIGTLWKSAAFCGVFGDAFMASTEIEGLRVGQSTRVLAAALAAVADSPLPCVLATLPPITGKTAAQVGDATTAGAPAATPDDAGLGVVAAPPVVDSRDTIVAALERAAGLLQSASQVAASLFDAQDGSGAASLAALAQLRGQVASVAPGTSMMLPVGWRTKKAGHALMLILQRGAEGAAADAFEVVVCNAGPGLQYHASSMATYPKPRFKTWLRLPGVPRAKFLDEGFMYMLYQAVITPNDDNDAKLLYEVLLPHLAGAPLLDVAAAQREPMEDAAASGLGAVASGAAGGDGEGAGAGDAGNADGDDAAADDAVEEVDADSDELSTPQRASLCFVKSTLAAVKFILRDAGLGARRVKVIMFAVRLRMLAQARADLRSVADINDSDRRLVKLACKQSAVAAVKLHRGGCIDTATLKAVHATVVELRQALATMTVVGQKFEYPAKVDMRMDAPLVPIPGFDLVHNTDSTELYAGEAQDSAPSLFVDLLEQGPKTTFEEVAATLLRAEAQCDRLRAKTAVSAASIATHQIACLVENLFMRVLPVPQPWSKELAESGATGPWIPKELSLDTQRACLRALYRLAVQYVAAVKSVKYDRMQSGKHVVVMACFQVCLDALLRLQASPCPSPLSAMLHVPEPPAEEEAKAGVTEEEAAAALAAALAAAEGWSCDNCTYVNAAGASECVMCGVSKGAPPPWACPRCTATNTPTASQCSVCNAPNPSASAGGAAGGGGGGGSNAAAAYGDMAKPPTNGTALPASPPAFLLSMTSFGKSTVEELTETLLLSHPDAAVARCSVLKYISGLTEDGIPVLYEFHPAFKYGGGDVTLSFVEQLLFSIGCDPNKQPPPNPLLDKPILIVGRPSETERLLSWLCHSWHIGWTVEGGNGVPQIFEAVPEVSYSRDITALFKLMLEWDPAQKFIGNKLWHTLHASCNWRPPEQLTGAPVCAARVGLFGRDYYAEVSEPQTGQMTNPARFIEGESKGRITEDDVLHSPTVSNFSDNLTQEDAEKFVSYLTAPYLRIPLVLAFLSEDRLGCLFNQEIRCMLERVMFEPLSFFDARELIAEGKPIVKDIPIVPKERAKRLGTPFGMLVNEVLHAPAGVVEPLLQLGYRIVSMCRGGYDSSFVDLLLFVLRLICKVEGTVVFVADTPHLRVSTAAHEALDSLLERLRLFTMGPARELLLKFAVQAEKARDVKAATKFHAHHSILFGHHRQSDMCEEAAVGVLASASYVLAWHCQGEVEPTRQEDDFDDYSELAYMAQRHRKDDQQAYKTDGTDALIPLAEVFEAVQLQRLHIMTWLRESAEPAALDRVLSQVAGVSLRRGNLQLRNWEPSSRPALKCVRNVESSHPYLAATDTYQVVHFPGAPHMTLTFDPRCVTERGSDYVVIYKDETLTDTWGPLDRLQGGSIGIAAGDSSQPGPSDWYGAHGRPALIIPGDKCVIHFHADGGRSGAGDRPWGFKLAVEAPVALLAAETLAAEVPPVPLPGSLGDTWPVRWCQTALAKCDNILEDARAFLYAHRDEMLAQHVAEASSDAARQAEAGGELAVNSLWRDPTGSMEVNLQTSEVYLHGRMVMPVPDDITRHKDFQEVFGSETPLCAVVANNRNRRWFRIYLKGYIYELMAWRSVSTEDSRRRNRARAASVAADIDWPCPACTVVNRAGSTRCSICGTAFSGDDVPWFCQFCTLRNSSNATRCLGCHKSRPMDAAANTGGDAGLDAGSLEAVCVASLARENHMYNSVPEFRDGAVHWNGVTYDAKYRAGQAMAGWVSTVLDPQVLRKVAGRDEVPVMWTTSSLLAQLASGEDPPDGSGDAPVLGHILMWTSPSMFRADIPAGSTSSIPGVWFDVQVLRHRRVLHVYQTEENGRRLLSSLVFSSDAHMSLRDVEGDGKTKERNEQGGGGDDDDADAEFAAMVDGDDDGGDGDGKDREDDVRATLRRGEGRYSAGQFYGTVDNFQRGDDTTQFGFTPFSSLVISRRRDEVLDQRGTETFVPARFLHGLLPDSLLEAYQFWQGSSTELTGYPITRGEATYIQVTLTLHGGSEASASGGAGDTGSAAPSWHALVRRRPLSHLQGSSRRSSPAAEPGSVTMEGEELLLLNVVNASRSSVLRRLGDWAMRLDNASHILVWSRSRGQIGEHCEVSLVQFPRLKANFVPKVDADGVVRLYSMEHAGLFVSDKRSEALCKQLQGIPQAVVLEDKHHQQFLFVPNVQLKRPPILDAPLSTELELVRSPEWMAAVKARFYLYPLHPSGAFLQPRSLAATFYLVALRMLHREYRTVAQLLTSCATDVPLTDEEVWSMMQLKPAASDVHPDGLACLLRLTLVCWEAGSPDAAPGKPPMFAAYVNKVARVSAECRLNLEEETMLAQGFKDKVRVVYLQTLTRVVEAQERVEAAQAQVSEAAGGGDGGTGAVATTSADAGAAVGGDAAAAADVPPSPLAPVSLIRSASYVRQYKSFETDHPYHAGQEVVRRIHFPGALQIEVETGENTLLGPGASVTLYKDDSLTAAYTDSPLKGSAAEPANAWPGSLDDPPLVVPGDTVVVCFRAGDGEPEWGVDLQFSASAPLSDAGVATAQAAVAAAAAPGTAPGAPGGDGGDDAAPELPFLPVTAFEGAKEGYAFYLGAQGLGYYPDSPPPPLDPASFTSDAQLDLPAYSQGNGGGRGAMVAKAAGDLVPTYQTEPWNVMFRYRRPREEQCSGAAAMELMDGLLSDRLSGEKRTLGFGLIYDLMRGDVRLSMMGDLEETKTQETAQASVDAAAAPAPAPAAAATWNCGMCTTPNEPSAGTCCVCGMAKGSWACGACTSINAADAGRCSVCSGPSPARPSAGGGTTASAAAAGDDLWQCKVCTVSNPASASTCGTCGQSKDAWSCVRCTTLNAAGASQCVVCNASRPAAAPAAASLDAAPKFELSSTSSSWTLGWLALQAMLVREPQDMKLQAPQNWPYVLAQPLMVAAEHLATSGSDSLLARFPPVPAKMREGKNYYMRHRDGEEWKQQLTTAAAACMTAPEWMRVAQRDVTEPGKAKVTLTVRASDAPPERPAVTDYSCDRRVMVPVHSADAAARFHIPVTAEDMVAFAGEPLQSLGLAEHVGPSPAPGSAGDLSRALPFDVSAKSEAKTYVGVQMIKRLTDDLVRSADDAVGKSVPRLRYLNLTHVQALKRVLADEATDTEAARTPPGGDGAGVVASGIVAGGEAESKGAEGSASPRNSLGFDEETSGMLSEARRRLLDLRQRLVKQQVHDAAAISSAVPLLEAAANDVPIGEASEGGCDEAELARRLEFWLQRSYGGCARLSFQFLVAGLLSSTSLEQLQGLNPFLSKDACVEVLDTVVVVLLTTSRFGQANRCIASVDTLLHEVHHLVEARLMKSFYADEAQARRQRKHRRVHRSRPTRQMVQHVLEETQYHAVRAKARLGEVIEMMAALVRTPPATVGVAAHAGGASVRALVELAVHLCNFDEAAAVAALADPSEVLSLLSMASRGCYRDGRKLPDVAASARVQRGGTEESALAMVHVLQHTADSVAADLVTRRHFIDLVAGDEEAAGGGTAAQYEYDPRFLVFEYLLGFVLRKRQVELVRQFAGAAKNSVSSVRQMIMGAGKTTVIAPLLALMLADGQSLVTNVVPSSLLEQTLGIMRGAFSALIQKRCYTLQFDRMSESSSSLEALTALVRKMERARRGRSIVCSTPEAVKSVMLKYVDLLQAVDASSAIVRTPQSSVEPSKAEKAAALAREFRSKALAADTLRDLLRMWGREGNGIVLLDEVDQLLHPLKSELNFPIGPWMPLHLSPRRWDFPIFLLDAVFFAARGKIAVPGFKPSAETGSILGQLRDAMELGRAKRAMQFSPHPVLLVPAFYTQHLMPLMALWSMVWLRAQPNIRGFLADPSTLKLTSAPLTEDAERHVLAYIKGSALEDAATQWVAEHASTSCMRLLNLARDWLATFLPHCLAKIDRVTYGLLRDAKDAPDLEVDSDEEDSMVEARRKKDASQRRKRRKGRRSRKARRAPRTMRDMNTLRRYLKARTLNAAKQQRRQAAKQGAGGGAEGADSQAKKKKGKHQSKRRMALAVPFVGKDVPSPSAEFAHPEVLIGLSVLAYRYEGLRRRDLHLVVTTLKKKLMREPGPFSERPSQVLFGDWLAKAWSDRQQQRRLRSAAGDTSDAVAGPTVGADRDAAAQQFGVLPLEMFQPDDAKQMDRLYSCLYKSPEVILHYLSTHVFPDVMQHQETKLMASGTDLGGEMLFNTRLGFSGTPSDLLPYELQPCMVEPGSDARMVRWLSSEALVDHTIVGSDWTVQGLLKWVATHEPPFHALIDRGALVTGMNNKAVARALLDMGLQDMEVVVYLDEKDQKMVLGRGSDKPTLLSECGVPMSRRFTFYDQIHTVGMDMKQCVDATAAVTLGKDMTQRDYFQACWRMRGLGKGQTVHLYIVGELMKLIRSVSDTGCVPVDVLAWLAVNSMRSEKLQYMQLCCQNLSNTWRKAAFGELVASDAPAWHDTDPSGLRTRFHDPIPEMPWLCPRCMAECQPSLQTCPACDTPRSCWRCETCTTVNQQDAKKCETCSSEREQWVCHVCTMRNPASLTECRSCNSVNPKSVQQEQEEDVVAVDASKLVVEEEAKEAPPPHPDCHIGSTAPKWMARCIHVFRDPLKKEIKSSLPEPVHFVDRLKRYAAPYSDFLVSEGAQAVLRRVYEEAATATVGGDDDANDAEAKAQAQGLDSEMVTEQEQEQEQEQEEEQQMQIQTMSACARDDGDANGWLVAHLAHPTFLHTDTEMFYKLNTFRLTPTAPPLAFPDQLYLSENHARFLHDHSLPRRLRNVVVVLEWTPVESRRKICVALSLAEVESLRRAIHTNHPALTGAVTGSPGPEVVLRTTNGVALDLPIDRTAGISADGADEAKAGGDDADGDAPSTDAAAATATTTAVAPPLPPASGAGVAPPVPPPVPVAATPDAADGAVADDVDDDEDDDDDDDEDLAAALALSLAEGGDDAPSAATPAPATGAGVGAGAGTPRRAPTKLSAEEAMPVCRENARFFNGEVFFDENQLIQLLRGLSASTVKERVAFYEQALRSRRRDRVEWKGTDLEVVFSNEDERNLMRLQELAARVRDCVRARFASLLEAFQAFDLNKDGWLSHEELRAGLLGLDIGLTTDDVSELVLQADRDGDGFLDYSDFAARFFDAAFAQPRAAVRAAEAMAKAMAPIHMVQALTAVEGGQVGNANAMTMLGELVYGKDAEGEGDGEGDELSSAAGDTATAVATTVGSGSVLLDGGDVVTVHDLFALDKVIDYGRLYLASGVAAEFLADGCVSTPSSQRATVVARGLRIAARSAYYEVTVLRVGNGCIGWARAPGFKPDSARLRGVGDDAHSWGLAVSGTSVSGRHNGATVAEGCTVTDGARVDVGDVIGCAVSITDTGATMTCSLHRTGDADAPAATATFTIADDLGEGLFPAITSDSSLKYGLNFGTAPFRFAPPNNAPSVVGVMHDSLATVVLNATGRLAGCAVPASAFSDMTVDGSLLVAHAGSPTAVVAGVLLTRGKWYYEVTVESEGMGRVGWADCEFLRACARTTSNRMVGDDHHSWGYDGMTAQLWNNTSTEWGMRWQAGDVVGVAVDLSARTMQWSVNGVWDGAMGQGVDKFRMVAGLVPAVTLSYSALPFTARINLGGTASPFAHAAPSASYRAVAASLAPTMPPSLIHGVSSMAFRRNSSLGGGAATSGSDTPPSGPVTYGRTRDSIQLRATSGFSVLTTDRFDDHHIGASSGTPSVVANGVRLASGKWYYEVHVTRAGRGQVGWADDQFFGNWASGTGVGDDAHSWGFNGHAKCAGHNGEWTSFGARWRHGDVIGVAVDIDACTMSYSLNGEWGSPMGTAIVGASFIGGLRPAVSVYADFGCRINFGEKPFEYSLPEGAQGVHAARSSSDGTATTAATGAGAGAGSQ